MERYSSRIEFNKFTREYIKENGFHVDYIDVYHIQVLQDYRVAAIFASAILSLLETSDENLKKIISQTIKECEAVSSDDSVYVMNGPANIESSDLLSDAVKKAAQAVAHAGNLLNNSILRFPEKLIDVVMKARNVCDSATKRMLF
ncbi:MAG: hypothetical protein UR66_C0005G0026 [Candidatus Moranbacteria bacterium GW2011_GWE1_35_17]|nr:MAG: hypothetical protein UR66_C0005G0026 [Candidatus Moranbacteria bacterium GW2011_GWE1_35_17]KKP83780.1 MAG: hypothetical protein UR83_C0033G0010 [Candidatus Moranbacteria bacterium GW2011_GWF2_35_54]KKP84025.1 MAG: hypothetical protein UR82_C0014G0004 [Candidatus Moranbacteria bacterium GW2011_GWF1_35_5]